MTLYNKQWLIYHKTRPNQTKPDQTGPNHNKLCSVRVEYLLTYVNDAINIYLWPIKRETTMVDFTGRCLKITADNGQKIWIKLAKIDICPPKENRKKISSNKSAPLQRTPLQRAHPSSAPTQISKEPTTPHHHICVG